MAALASLQTAPSVLVVSEDETFRLRLARQFGRNQGSIVAVSSWTRAVPHLTRAHVVVIADVRTVVSHRDLALQTLAGRDVRLVVLGARGPLPRWLRAVDAVAVDARQVPQLFAEVCGG